MMYSSRIVGYDVCMIHDFEGELYVYDFEGELYVYMILRGRLLLMMTDVSY